MNEEFEEVYVSRRFWEEINYASYLASKLAGTPIECTGIGIAKDNSELTYATEILNQDVTASEVYSKWTEAIRPAKEKNSYVTIKWHSHGHFPRFHSTQDEINIKQIGPEIIRHRLKRKNKEKYSISKEDGTYFLQNQHRKIKLKTTGEINLEELIDSADEVRENKFISLVINHESYNEDNPEPEKCFGEVAYFDHEDIENKTINPEPVKKRKVKLKVLEDCCNIDRMKILEEIANKIKYQAKYLKEYENYHILKEEIQKNNLNQKIDSILSAQDVQEKPFEIEVESQQPLQDSNKYQETFKIESPEKYKARVTMDWGVEVVNDLERLKKECKPGLIKLIINIIKKGRDRNNGNKRNKNDNRKPQEKLEAKDKEHCE